ncbi:LysE family translocator [Kytococcus sp. Marseille-QA3725]
METYLPLAGVWILGVMSPGPDFVAVLRTAMRHGDRAASSTAMGVVTGIAVWIVLALVGFTALVQAEPWIAVAMRVAGAVFLVGFGLYILWGLWRSRGAQAESAVPASEPGGDDSADALQSADTATGTTEPTSLDCADSQTDTRGLTQGAAFRLGLATNVANPKALVFFGALFSTLLPPDMSWAARGGVLAMMVVIALAWFLLVAWAASRPPLVRLYERAGRTIDAVAAIAFVGLGVALLLE